MIAMNHDLDADGLEYRDGDSEANDSQQGTM